MVHDTECPGPRDSEESERVTEPCDVCGSDRVTWQKCKLICLNCGTILKSCADL